MTERDPIGRLLRGLQLPEADAVEECERFFVGNFPLPEQPPAPETLPQRLRNAFAEAAIFSGIVRPDTPIRLPEVWNRIRPFGENTPELGALLAIPNRAMACFPTCAGDRSALWHLFLFFGCREAAACDLRRFLSGEQDFGTDTAVFLSSAFAPPTRKLRGCSWQLAARAAEELSPEFRPELARRWLITGEVRGEKVLRVKLGAKRDLFENTERNILLPRENQSDLDVTASIYPTETVEQALRLIDRRGFAKTDIELPPGVRDLHILIGGALQPAVAVILLLSPRRVFLWSSPETRGKAEMISSVLHSLLPAMTSEICVMDSHDLQSAYSQISDRLKQEECQTADTIVCNTGGNRLMGTAALLAANSCNLTVVYRDLNAAPDVLTALQLGEANRYQSGDICVNRCEICDRIDWDWLYSEDRQPIASSKDLLGKLLSDGTAKRGDRRICDGSPQRRQG